MVVDDVFLFAAGIVSFAGCVMIALITIFIIHVDTKKKKKRLIILDFNGVICYREHISERRFQHLDHQATQLHNSVTWTRPGWPKFRDTLMKHFDVAVWSSCRGQNFENLLEHLFGERKRDLIFAWDQTYCEAVGWDEQRKRVLVYEKPLSAVHKFFPQYEPFMLDDSPTKMRNNPDGSYLIVKSWTPDMDNDTELQSILSQLLTEK
jgi:hypothetical protein